MKNTQRKKAHHFVHDGYIDAWRTTGRLFVSNLLTGHTFEPTGRNSVAAISRFYDFSFDDTVVALLNYTFREKAISTDSGNMYKLMLSVINFMKNFDYEHKTENFLEDFYSQIENRISVALRSVFRGELQIISDDPEVFDGLIFLYCLQMMRTQKARKDLSDYMVQCYYGDTLLSAQQKDEYIKANLLINSLAMASDILEKGCRMRLSYAKYGEKFINSDAPVIVSGGHVSRLEDHRGCIPLSPHFLMEIDLIGLRFKTQTYCDITNIEVETLNQRMIQNADKYVYFSSNSQRRKYMDLGLLKRQR